MRKDVDFKDYAGYVLKKMASGGVFLTSQYEQTLDTMTIGWGGICYYWKEPVFEAPVRYSRYSHDIIDKSGVFTISVPMEGDDVSKQIAYCGTHSGRNVNKFAECGITAEKASIVNVPIIKECSLHFECEVIFKHDINKENLAPDVDEKWYPDYHTVYFGKIVACYITCDEN